MGKYNDVPEMIADLEQVKADCLFDSYDITAVLPPVAEQHFLAAIALIAQAVTALRLADYARMRGD